MATTRAVLSCSRNLSTGSMDGMSEASSVRPPVCRGRGRARARDGVRISSLLCSAHVSAPAQSQGEERRGGERWRHRDRRSGSRCRLQNEDEDESACVRAAELRGEGGSYGSAAARSRAASRWAAWASFWAFLYCWK